MAYSDYETVIGLEIHTQLKTKSKMFCSCSSEFASGDNQNTCPVCTGQPGALPTVNKKAVELSSKIGLALGCEIDRGSVFARKNYFYPDMPKGFQISQYEKPLCLNGEVSFFHKGEERKIRIERAHMEEDAGKSTHFGYHSLVNLNRASTPLLEIVSHPDLRSPEEAADYARMIRRMVRYLDACDGNLEEGSMRCDCNISVRKKGETELGTKVEIKNINSFRFVEKALQYEVERQIDVLETGGVIEQETRLYDIDKNQTQSMRTKENAEDYRYFPEPDLLPVQVSEKDLSVWKESLPEGPYQKFQRWMQDLKLTAHEADQLSQEKSIADYFEEILNCGIEVKLASSWVLGEVFSVYGQDFEKIDVEPKRVAELLSLIQNNTLSRGAAKKVFAELAKDSRPALEIAKSMNLLQVSDVSLIEEKIEALLSQHPDLVEEYRGGKEKVFGFFVGEMMKASKGQFNPKLVGEVLRKKLKGE